MINSTFKSRFTRRFLMSLSNIKRANGFGHHGPAESDEEIHRRSHRIKIAAYSSMAQAVGSKRAWSRALLFRLRNRARIHGILRNRKKKKVIKRNTMNKTDLLRKLVPGGATMEISGLLEETAHYIKCLSTQVKVMQSIVDRCSK